MTQAVAYRESQNGQQEQSSGLIIHRGPLNAAVVRAIGSPATGGAIFPRDGQGSGSSLELAHTPKSSSSIQSYDRDTSQWLDLNLYGKNVNLGAFGGKVIMPAQSVQSSPASAKWIGNWVIPSTGTWTETPVQQVLSVTAGNPVRVEACGTLTCAIAGAVMYVGLGLDGGIVHDSMFCAQPGSGSNTLAGYHVTGYFTSQISTSGTHRFSTFLYTNAGPSAAGLWSGAYNYLWITEQRA
jgi:hypothetical protein